MIHHLHPGTSATYPCGASTQGAPVDKPFYDHALSEAALCGMACCSACVRLAGQAVRHER